MQTKDPRDKTYDARVIITVSDALRVAANRPIIFDDPVNPDQKSAIFPVHRDFKKPNPSRNSSVHYKDHYYLKIGGLDPGVVRGLSDGDTEVKWGTMGEDKPNYEVGATDAALPILRTWVVEEHPDYR